ncbi:hypothetical protein DC522_29095 [Microvirga sp. KLBC 81]|uniref:hypothetical protein n=1 Tax=Microvirga sp. KLBC 81 TaxID=1862707 RepID=UPI000D51E78D|nr:hypothetical protein [Microvirga sp. KLBC 81]PVE21008.1 hypothetical protein DC522_29095 [Microvirga sp. KLBC 81]
MLERYFVKPETVDRIRMSWLGPHIEFYITALTEQGYSARSILRRVPILMRFGEFAHARHITSVAQAEGRVDAFVAEWLAARRDKSVGLLSVPE